MKNEKKKNAEPEMGYCPFEHKAGRRRAGGALGAGVLGCWARGMAQARVGGAGRAELAGHGAVTRPAGRLRSGLCMLAGPNCGTVHLTQF